MFMKPSTWKKLAIGLGVLVLLVIASALLLPRLIDPNLYRERIVSELEKTLGGTVRIGRITWGINTGLWVEVQESSVAGSSAIPVDFELPRTYGEISLLPLLGKKIVINELVIENPIATVRVEAKTEEARKGGTVGGAADAESGLPVDVLIREVRLKNGRVTVEDSLSLPGRKFIRRFDRVDVEARTSIAEGKISFVVSLESETKPGFKSFAAEGTLSGLTKALNLKNPFLRVHAKLSSLSMDAIKLYLKLPSVAERMGGEVSMEVNYEGDFGSRFRANGIVDLAEVSYSDPLRWDQKLPPGAPTIAFRMSAQPDNLAVEELKVKLGQISLAAKATVQGLNRRPLITNAQLSGTLSLADTVPLIPWRLLGENGTTLRAILEKGGTVSIERANLSHLDPGEPPSLEALISALNVQLAVTGAGVPAVEGLPGVENVSGSIQLEKGVLTVERSTGQMGSVKLPNTTATIVDMMKKPVVLASIKGPLLLGDGGDKDPLQLLLRRVGIERLEGRADLDLTLQLDTARPKDFVLQGTAGLQDFRVATSFTPTIIERLSADITIHSDAVDVTHCALTVVGPKQESSRGGRFELETSGRLDDWRGHPLLTLRSLKSSRIALPMVASIIPWEKEDNTVGIIRDALRSSGDVTVEGLAFANLDFREVKKDPRSVLGDLKGQVSFVDLSVQPTQWFPRIHGVTGRVRLENDTLTGSELMGMVGPLTLPVLDITATDLSRRASLKLKARGPLRLLNPEKEETKKLLMSYGFKSITVDAQVDLGASVDFTRPAEWTARGALVLESVHAESYSSGAVLENLRGALNFSRDKSLEIAVSGLEGTLNGSPIWVNGKLAGGGTPQALLDLQTKINQVDFAKVATLIPLLRDLDLRGSGEADLDIHAPYKRLEEMRVKGTAKVAGLGLKLPDQRFKIDQGDAQIVFKGDAIDIQDTRFLLNDQEVNLLGSITNLREPIIALHAESPSLDLDRLIVTREKTAATKDGREEPRAKPTPRDEMKEEKFQAIVRVMTVNSQVKVDRGRYHGQEFKNLTFDVDYAQGVLRGLDVRANVGDGAIRATGTADLRDPKKSLFSADPRVEKVPVEVLLAFMGTEKSEASGPLTFTGHMEGLLGATQEVLGSLKGKAAWNCGPGRARGIGPFGTVLFKVLSIASVSSLKFTSLRDDLSKEGISFNALKGRVSMSGGKMTIEEAHFESKALNIYALGKVDLVHQQVDAQLALGLIGTVDKVLGWVPLAGKVAQRLTKIYVGVKGPLADPSVRILPIRGVYEGLKAGGKAAGSLLEDLSGSLQNSPEKSQVK
jgi:hypothetical protein